MGNVWQTSLAVAAALLLAGCLGGEDGAADAGPEAEQGPRPATQASQEPVLVNHPMPLAAEDGSAPSWGAPDDASGRDGPPSSAGRGAGDPAPSSTGPSRNSDPAPTPEPPEERGEEDPPEDDRSPLGPLPFEDALGDLVLEEGEPAPQPSPVFEPTPTSEPSLVPGNSNGGLTGLLP